MLNTSVIACMLLLSHILVSHSFLKCQIRLYYLGFPRWFSGKESACNAGDTGDTGLIPGSGRSPGGGGTPLQYSCLGNPMDRGAWWATVHGVVKDLDMAKLLSTHNYLIKPVLQFTSLLPSLCSPILPACPSFLFFPSSILSWILHSWNTFLKRSFFLVGIY